MIHIVLAAGCRISFVLNVLKMVPVVHPRYLFRSRECDGPWNSTINKAEEIANATLKNSMNHSRKLIPRVGCLVWNEVAGDQGCRSADVRRVVSCPEIRRIGETAPSESGRGARKAPADIN